MANDPKEVAKFLAALAKLSPEGIRQRLDKHVIHRAWKRDLAEADLGRRVHEAHARDEGLKLEARSRELNKNDLSRRVWMITSMLIVAGMAMIWISVHQAWHL